MSRAAGALHERILQELLGRAHFQSRHRRLRVLIVHALVHGIVLGAQLVHEFETAAARFEVGDAVVLQNVSAKVNGLVGTIAGPINSKLSFPVRVAKEGLPPKINVKSSNLAAAEDTYSDEL